MRVADKLGLLRDVQIACDIAAPWQKAVDGWRSRIREPQL